MNICNNEQVEKFKVGRLYKVKAGSYQKICIFTSSGKMVRLEDGRDDVVFTSSLLWEDVTDLYCLQKVK